MSIVIGTIAVVGLTGLLIGILLVSADNKFYVEVSPVETAVRECLPGNNCGACGQAGCDAMAAAIAAGKAPVNGCPVGGAPVAEKIAEIMGVDSTPAADKKVAFVRCAGTCGVAVNNAKYFGIQTCEAAAVLPGKGDKACQFGCLGLGSCTKACQFDAIHIVDGVAKVDREKCVGCGKCADTCPQKLIEIVPDSAPLAVQCANREKGPVVKKQCAAGCIGCGICMKQCEHEAITVTGNVAHIDYSKCVGCGKCAEKCPAKIIRMR